mmetsp:Transcript_60246/g.69216  ORF Transcript_60246/g.69216 Transcript_60246/m.69216 type:complete len:661 (-) Transcript_60246:372-2354(-)
MKFCTVSLLSFMAAQAVMADFEDPMDFIPNPQQTDRTERPCLADCVAMQENCYEVCEEVCTPLEPPAEGEFCEEVCGPVCQIGEVCTFEVGREELSSELGYYAFKGAGGAGCPGGTNPVLGIKKGATYLFTQRRTGNYYHPLGFAYAADGALDDQPELEPGICPGTVKGEEDTTECDCKETGLCPAPMYYTSNNYLGAYSNNPYLAPINGESDDFGLDAYEPQFFYPLLQWKGTPREEDPEGPGYYQVALHFPEDEEYTGDFFYFCHIHQFMTGRFKFVDNETGLSISPDNTLRIPYEYQEPDAYDRSCGATGISESQLPDMECPTTFVCDAPDAAVAPFAAKFAECVDSMNCAMLKGITTKISSDSPIALFNHQMIPHHQQAVNMCKALDVAQGTECEDIFDEDEPKCVLKVLCQEIINVQNAQIQTMRGILQQLELPDTDNCIVDIPVDPQTACEAQSEITGYTWCVLTQTCVPPGDDACLEAECEENSIVTGKHWCALTQTCFEQGDQSCDKAYCELDSENTGYTWCELTGTCVAPGDDACLEAACEENSVSTGYHWCALTQICFPPGDRECDKAYCELESESTGFSWCDLLEKCLPPTEDCVLPTGPPAPTDAPVATFAPTAMATFSPTLMPTRSSTSKSSKSSKSRRHTRQLKYE